MLTDTITVNSGSPATDKIFSGIQRDGNTVTYTKDSPQGDLLGVWNLDFRAETTKQGTVRSLGKTRVPYYDATLGKYTGTVILNTTLARESFIPLTFVDMVTETHLKGMNLSAVRTAFVAARH